MMAYTNILTVWLLMKCCLCNIEPAEGRRCIERERSALLDIGADICDPHIGTWISSWRNEGDCCSWRGIGCDNLTGHVTSLNLRGSDDLYGPISRCATEDTLFYYQENLWLRKNGQYLHYSSVLDGVTVIDISSNSFSGEFPRELTRLSGLVFLNMSRNHFTGHIPEDIGDMGQLQLLDLSMNNLSGKIPSSISNLNFLSNLNVSHNKLSGRIPSGNQLQTLSDNSYNGNDGLCGRPLQQCLNDQQSNPHTIGQGKKTHDDRSVEIWIYASSALGFVGGFLASFGTIMIK